MHEWHDMTSGWKECSGGTCVKGIVGSHKPLISTAIISTQFALQLALIKLIVQDSRRKTGGRAYWAIWMLLTIFDEYRNTIKCLQ